ncbi:MAG: hypothetical protein ACRED3_16995, partial [Bradyrhizobium sp.]
LKTVNRTSAITIQMAAFANMLLFKSNSLRLRGQRPACTSVAMSAGWRLRPMRLILNPGRSGYVPFGGGAPGYSSESG